MADSWWKGWLEPELREDRVLSHFVWGKPEAAATVTWVFDSTSFYNYLSNWTSE
jgi:hypothetical protein